MQCQILTLVMCVLFTGAAFGQGPNAKKPKPPSVPDLERRIASLEKLVIVLDEQVKALTSGPRGPLPTAAAKQELKVFTLKKLDADDVARTLQQLLSANGGGPRIAAFKGTQSVLVLAERHELEMVEAIILQLDTLADLRERDKAKSK